MFSLDKISAYNILPPIRAKKNIKSLNSLEKSEYASKYVIVRNIHWHIILILLTILSLINCDKVNDGERYCGNWSFVTYYKDYFTSGFIISQDTTYSQGQIVKGSGKRELIVYYHPSKYIIITVEKDGRILNTEWGVNDYRGGEFDGLNKFSFKLKSGDLSHRKEEEIYGER